ncbi:NDP-hexose 2,3-dehydratase family protein [Streptomyces morookaense]|uniref:NDP-hexose 2,3-dehydratase family protein n=1 Tax=Streptomyces morookaense TaxID=1970 RepID=UPI0033E2D700
MVLPPAVHEPLTPRGTAERCLESARTSTTPGTGGLPEIRQWLEERARVNEFTTTPVPFAQLDGWRFTDDTGDLVHRSGGFFRIRGLDVSGADGPVPHWSQPVIDQPEVGVLGMLAKEIDGVLCLLVQAKMEPGNINVLQLSPTVQATRSNFLRLHGGAATRYLEYFTEPGRGRVLADVLHSEQGGSFYRKRNRNIIVETDEDVVVHDDYRWVTVGQLHALLREDNMVNMDARTVLSCLPLSAPAAAFDDAAQSETAAIQSWLNNAKSRSSLVSRLVPLASVDRWRRSEDAISHEENRYFQVIGTMVRASNREVTSWGQPLIAPRGRGVVAFLVCRTRGDVEVLVHARAEGGTPDVVELGPTVQCVPDNFHGLPADQQPRYLDLVREAAPGDILYDTLLSEEGGRFYQAENRYLAVGVDDEVRSSTPPPGFRWMALRQLYALVRHGGYLNVEARSLLACLQPMV